MNRRQFMGFVVFPAAIASILAFLFFVAKIDTFRVRTATEALQELTHAEEDNVRYKAAIRLKELVDKGEVERATAATALRAALQDESPSVRFNAAEALAHIDRETASEDVAKLLSDENIDVRRVAAFLLGHLKAPGARPALTQALEDDWEPVRWNAAVALARMEDASGRIVLHNMLRAPTPRSVGKAVGTMLPNGTEIAPEPDHQTHQNAIGALALVGDENSVIALEGFVQAEVDPDLDDLARAVIKTIEDRRTKAANQPAAQAGDES